MSSSQPAGSPCVCVELLAGDSDYQDFKRLPGKDEAVVLRSL